MAVSAGLVLDADGVAVEALLPPGGVREELLAAVLGAVLAERLSSGEPLDGGLLEVVPPSGGVGGGVWGVGVVIVSGG